MNITIKATQLELTDELRERIEEIGTKLEKLASVTDPSSLICEIEVGKTTAHHRHGNVFRAEINFSIAGTFMRTEAEGETPRTALDAAYLEMKEKFTHSKQERQGRMRRLGARIKDAFRWPR